MPGVWKVVPVCDLDFRAPDKDDFYIRSADGMCIAIVWGGPGTNRTDAALLAAAPQLLEALKDSTHRVRYLLQFASPELVDEIEREIAAWEAALALATGRAEGK